MKTPAMVIAEEQPWTSPEKREPWIAKQQSRTATISLVPNILTPAAIILVFVVSMTGRNNVVVGTIPLFLSQCVTGHKYITKKMLMCRFFLASKCSQRIPKVELRLISMGNSCQEEEPVPFVAEGSACKPGDPFMPPLRCVNGRPHLVLAGADRQVSPLKIRCGALLLKAAFSIQLDGCDDVGAGGLSRFPARLLNSDRDKSRLPASAPFFGNVWVKVDVVSSPFPCFAIPPTHVRQHPRFMRHPPFPDSPLSGPKSPTT